MALVVLSKVEQRLDAVRAVLAGASVTEVAAGVGVSRVTCMSWLRRYLVDGCRGWRTGRIGPARVRIRSAMRWRCWWPRCAGSIHGGGRSGSGWSC